MQGWDYIDQMRLRDYEKRTKLSRNARPQSVGKRDKRVEKMRKTTTRMRKERGNPPLVSFSPRGGKGLYVRARAHRRSHVCVCVCVSAKDRFLVTSFLHRVYKTQPGLALTNSLTEQRFSFRTHEISDRKDRQRNSAYIFNINVVAVSSISVPREHAFRTDAIPTRRQESSA